MAAAAAVGGKAKYSVLLPTYCERENIALIVWLILKEFSTRSLDVEIIVIDDGSPDGTQEEVRKLQAEYGTRKIVLRPRPSKLGLGSAYQHGLQVATGEWVIAMDADLSHHPRHLSQFIDCQADSGADIICGTRYTAGGGVDGWGFSRKVTSRGANILAASLLGVRVSDLTGAFRMYRRSCIERLMPLVTTNGYAFQMEIIVRACHMGMSVREVPIVFVNRIYGDSKLGGAEIKQFLFALVKLFFTL